MANSELFSCIVPVDNQRSYSADEQIDQRLMQNIWSLSETLNERKIRVLSMWGMSLSNKYLHRWKLTDSAECTTCKCVETDVHICTICKNPDIVRVREEWAGAIHTTINDHMGHKRFQLNPAKFQNLWQTCDGEMASWSPGNAPAKFATHTHFATEEDRLIAKVAEKAALGHCGWKCSINPGYNC